MATKNTAHTRDESWEIREQADKKPSTENAAMHAAHRWLVFIQQSRETRTQLVAHCRVTRKNSDKTQRFETDPNGRLEKLVSVDSAGLGRV